MSSLVFLLTAISIALGAFGHGSQWPKHVRADVAGLAPDTIRLLALVWYWVSGTMLVFGLLLLWAWWRLRQGDRSLSRLAGGRFLLRGGHPRRRVSGSLLLDVRGASRCAVGIGLGAVSSRRRQLWTARLPSKCLNP